MPKEIKPLNIEIDARSAMPVYEQVKQAIKLSIISSYLEEGDQLMPIRELAAALRVNPNTIVKVYYQLDVEGYIYSQPGTGYFVKHDIIRENSEERRELFSRVTDEYIAKALKLGYALQDMTDELKGRARKTAAYGDKNTQKDEK